MSIEEKAKAYDAALERAKGILCDGNCSDIETIFPELRESEDEVARKEIIDYLNFAESHNLLRAADYEKKKGWIDWLERKKTPSVSFNPALGFDPGSAVVYHNDENEEETTRKELLDFVRSFWTDHKEKLPQASRWVTYLEKQKEIPMPNSTELIEMWDKEEAMLKEKDFRGDTWRIAYNAFLDGFAQGMMVKQKEQKKDNPLEDFSKGYNAGYYHGRTNNEQKSELVPHPITYTYPSDASRDEQLKMALLALLNSDSIKVAGNKFTKQDLIDWVEQKPDIELIQRSWYMEGYHDRKFGMEPRWIIKTGEGGPKHEPNPKYGQLLDDEQKPAEWSEEDEEMWMDIKSHMIHGSFIPFDKIEWIENRLKSLRPSWKPSEEQMEALESEIKYCYACGMHNRGRELQSLHEQLQRQM